MAPSVNTINKAKQYLGAGSVKVLALDASRASVQVTGSGNYLLQFNGAGWQCSCPAKTECAHILACKLITNLRPLQSVTLGGADPELQAFLDAYPANRPDDNEPIF